MTSRPKDPKTARNKNILVIGGSGSGKTRFFVKPSLLQMHSSYVVTDPKGQLLRETGKLLAHGGPKRDENGKPVRDKHGKVVYEPYRIKALNTINFSKSMKYNPLAYVRSEKDILKLVNVIIANTKGDGEKSSEDFWIKAERLLYCALIGYIWYEAEPEEKNFITLLELINACEAREDDETYKSPVDILFDELAQAQPEHFAVKQYVKFKMAAGKTLKSILVSCGARLSPFDIAALSYGLLKFFLYIIQRGLRVGGGLVLAVCFPDVPDDAVQIIVHDMAVKIAFLHLPQFQRPHIEVIFSGRIFAHDGLPGGLQHQIHLLHPHIGNLVDADFHIYHQPPEIRVGSQFAEKPVVDFAAAQKFHHIITQMQRLKFCVWVIFIFRQSHQIVGGHAVKVRQRCNRKRADVLVVIGFIFSQCGFRQAGLFCQLFQRQVLVHHSQVFEPLRD